MNFIILFLSKGFRRFISAVVAAHSETFTRLTLLHSALFLPRLRFTAITAASGRSADNRTAYDHDIGCTSVLFYDFFNGKNTIGCSAQNTRHSPSRLEFALSPTGIGQYAQLAILFRETAHVADRAFADLRAENANVESSLSELLRQTSFLMQTPPHLRQRHMLHHQKCPQQGFGESLRLLQLLLSFGATPRSRFELPERYAIRSEIIPPPVLALFIPDWRKIRDPAAGREPRKPP